LHEIAGARDYPPGVVSSAAPTTRACIAVTPFDNLVEGGQQDYFSRGFTDDLVADLSRFSNLAVISGAPAEPPTELSPDYLLEGHLRRSGERLRVSTQLLEATSRSVVWAERFDERAEDIFEIQDAITAQVVAAVSDRIHADLLAAAKRKPLTALQAYDHWLRGHDALKEGTLRADQRARKLFGQALSLDPEYSRAHLGLSLSYFNEWSCQLWQRWDENERLAFEHAERARRLDPDDHYAQLVLGRVLLFRREFERAEQHLERALALNPNDADCLAQLAVAFTLLGRAPLGGELFERARTLNPRHDAWYWGYGAVTNFGLGNFEQVLQCAARVGLEGMVDMAALMAAAHHYLGQPQQAQHHIDLYLDQFARKIAPGRQMQPGEALRWLQHVNPYRYSRDEARLVEGVRAAGLVGSQRPAPIEPPADSNAFRKVGSLWQVSYAGRDAWLPDLKGFVDIAALLARPGEQVHCAELMGGVSSGSDDVALDSKAKAAYQRRVAELRAELEEAESFSDPGRAERARTELEQLAQHLAASVGLGGRSRKLGAPTERARSAVTQRIKACVRRVEETHPALYEHLSSALRTGSFCSYVPEKTIDWEL
jgi:TolB-like protein/cytochrome c-type biogenesis protein CcmH/NrfG